MSNLVLRKDVVLYVHDSGFMAPGAGYRVFAAEVGAIAAAASAGTAITVDAGHGFAANDKFILNPGSSAALGYDAYGTVSSVGATTVNVGSAVSIAVGDVLFNLGPDTGATAPNYDGSGVAIYSDMDGGTAIASETVTADANGNFQYWSDGVDIWELYLNPSLKPVGVRPGVAGDAIAGPSGAVTDNALVRFDGTSGRRVQAAQSTEDDSGNLTIVGALDHNGSTVGLYGVTPVVRPAAYTQTYSTATRTHANLTSAALGGSTGGTANSALDNPPNPADSPGTADALRDDLVANTLPDIRNNFADLQDQSSKIAADLANIKQVLNSVIDDLQSQGLLQ